MNEVKHVILAQHNQVQRNLLKSVFERSGLSTIATESGTHALEMIEKHGVKIVIIVDHLEDMPFQELTGMITSDNNKAIVLVCSSEFDKVEQEECKMAGAFAYMELKLDKNPLIRLVKKALEVSNDKKSKSQVNTKN